MKQTFKTRLPLNQTISENVNARNIIIGGYPTMNFDALEGPSEAFTASEQSEALTAAAEQLDLALGIYKIGLAHGKLTAAQYAAFEEHLTACEELLDEEGVLEDHAYIEDVLEPVTAEMVDIDALLDDAYSVEGEEDDDFEDESEGDDIFDDEYEDE
jgi:hypothetical protein